MLMIMDTVRLPMLLVYSFVLLKVSSSSSVDRYEHTKPSAVVNIIHTLKETEYQLDGESSLYDIDFNSGDYELTLPRVAFSTKPKHPSVMASTENKRKSRRKGKGKGRKKNPCLEEHKHFCIHGVCHYLKELQSHTCVCDAGYSGERCHMFTLAVAKQKEQYSRRTALAVMAVVLSLVCLAIIGMLLTLRYHKRKGADEESEVKVKPETTSVPQKPETTSVPQKPETTSVPQKPETTSVQS